MIEDLLEVVFKYRGSKREIIAESSNLCGDIVNELQARHDISQSAVTVSFTPATAPSNQPCGDMYNTESYFLQNGVVNGKNMWMSNVQVMLTEGDKLMLVKICSG